MLSSDMGAPVACPACSAAVADGARSCPACGCAIDAATVGLGAVLAGRYDVHERLGHGGMGTVFRAFDRVLQEEIAIKVLRGDVGEDLARRFRTEIKLAHRVMHRNVCRIYDYGEVDGLRYITMELVAGTDLKQVVRSRAGLPAREALRIGLQIADGLAAIHEAGIVHRDLKTSNLMLDRAGVVRLMDFGIAKDVLGAGRTAMTATGQVIGTPDYMSPEQAKGQKIDLRSDLYSLGIVLYELFTGHTPFRGDTPIAVILMHVGEPPPLTGPAAAGIPPSMVPVLARLLAKTPEERYPSALEVGVELRKGLDGLETAPPRAAPEVPRPAPAPPPRVSTPPPPPAPPPVPPPTVRARHPPAPAAPLEIQTEPARMAAAPAPAPSGSRPLLLAAAAAIVVGLAGAVLVLGWLTRRPGPAPPTTSAAQTPTTIAPVPATPVPSTTAEPSTVVSIARPKPPGTLAVDAWPWGTVEALADEAGRAIDLPRERETPLSLELPPGRYTVEVRTARGSRTLPVVVASGQRALLGFALEPVDAEDYLARTGF